MIIRLVGTLHALLPADEFIMLTFFMPIPAQAAVFNKSRG